MNVEMLKRALSVKFGVNIIRADCQAEPLHGGTLGDVRLVTGTAGSDNGDELSFRLVVKTQKKWERYMDPGSWRREYDLYASDLGAYFSDTFRWPECYCAEMNEEEDQITLWMEYVDGVSGLNLTADMYEGAAYELGRFQGRLYKEQPEFLRNVTNLSGIDYAKNFYLHYRSWSRVYDYIRSDNCEIPRHLCEMIIHVDEQAEAIFRRIEKLPVVFCHRDFWVANIICSDGKIVLIDWDTTGWGYMGEDIASLIADEADVPRMIEYYRRCIPAYYKGFSVYADVSPVEDNCVYELSLLLYGYRIVEWYLNAEDPEYKGLQVDTLQKIFEMKGR